MIVVDTSAVLEVLLETRAAPAVSRYLLAPGETLYAPHLIDLEITHVLRRYRFAGELSSARAGQVLRDFADLPVERYPHEPLVPRIWQLRHNFTAYDAAYLALAEALDAPLLTRDAALATTGVHQAQVTLV